VKQDRRADLIALYKAGVSEVEAALEDAGETELDAVPAEGEWSARMVVHHLADSESNSYVRVRTLLAEDEPFIQGYDEKRFASRLHYDRPTEASLAVFRAVRASTVELLDRLGDEDWSRAGTHSESGPYSMDEWLEIYAAHAFDHAEQIRRARGAASGS
jgi:DinB superfamily